MKPLIRVAILATPLVIIVLAVALADPALAQQLSVAVEKGQMSWTPGTGGGPVEEYRVKCGRESGKYMLPAVKIVSPATSTPIARLLPGPGKYFCVVTAANRDGESGPSNEVAVVLDAARLPTDSAPPSEPPTPASGANHLGNPGEYRIGPEDLLQITVWKNEAVSRIVPVRPDGKISLPLLNDVQAAGLTALELRDVVTRKLADYMPNPEVSVIVSEVRSFKISVVGEVTRPARYELKSWTTVLDALALAGGFTPFAARSRIVILRPDGNTVKRIPFNYNKVTSSRESLLDRIMNAGGEAQENFYLQNGDIVLVP